MECGDTVTVLAPSPASLDALAGRVNVAAGDATNGPAKGAYQVGDRLPMKFATTVSRADVADFTQKAAHSGEWIHRDAVITD